MLCADQHPDYRSIARLRRRHLEALGELFVQALRLCKQAKLVGLGLLALDGTKVRANASRHKAMSYERMVKKETQLLTDSQDGDGGVTVDGDKMAGNDRTKWVRLIWRDVHPARGMTLLA